MRYVDTFSVSHPPPSFLQNQPVLRCNIGTFAKRTINQRLIVNINMIRIEYCFSFLFCYFN